MRFWGLGIPPTSHKVPFVYPCFIFRGGGVAPELMPYDFKAFLSLIASSHLSHFREKLAKDVTASDIPTARAGAVRQGAKHIHSFLTITL